MDEILLDGFVTQGEPLLVTQPADLLAELTEVGLQTLKLTFFGRKQGASTKTDPQIAGGNGPHQLWVFFLHSSFKMQLPGVCLRAQSACVWLLADPIGFSL